MTLYHSPVIVTSGLVMALDAANIKSYPGSGTAWIDDSSSTYYGGNIATTPTFSSAIKGNLTINELNYCDVINYNLVGSSKMTFQTIFKWNSGNSVTTTTAAPAACIWSSNQSNMQSTATASGFTWYNLTFNGTGIITPAAQLTIASVPHNGSWSIDYTLSNSTSLFIGSELRLTMNGTTLDAVPAGSTSSGTFSMSMTDVVKIQCFSILGSTVTANQMSGSFALTGGGQCSQIPGDGMLFGYPNYAVWGYSGALGFNTAANDLYGLSSSAVTSLGLRDNFKNYAFVMSAYSFGGSMSANKIYINGVSQTLGTILGSPINTNMEFNTTFRINGWSSGPTIAYASYGMNSNMALFLAYNRELTNAEILQNYNATKGRFS